MKDLDIVLNEKADASIFNYQKHKNSSDVKHCKYAVIDFKADRVLLLVELKKFKFLKEDVLEISASYDNSKVKIEDNNWYLFKEKPTDLPVIEYGSPKWKEFYDYKSEFFTGNEEIL